MACTQVNSLVFFIDIVVNDEDAINIFHGMILTDTTVTDML